ncbi:hypothetical protein GCM10007860_34820 [Chitiniphilus shinanonensis]|uniref:DUF4401 domain-containing protein n=1 Tax=Chitiniphilus shinanonensis TaxID=553088 RepID=A0ABQ6BXS1_9NEIS|nr:DUF4401 domain-containing protein [Chitiniphilus shinanonensis]GLS06304.1 hypothetical protein GCM10007860_34820 [Chitiniphilus shinanonensis]
MKPWPQVIDELRASGALSGEPADAVATELPWSVQAIQTVAAWVAAILVLAAGMTLWSASDGARMLLGAMILAAATAAMRLGRVYFLAQAGVPLALGGAFMMVLSSPLERHVAWSCFVVGAVLFCLAGPRLLRLIAAMLMLGACWDWLNPRWSGEFFTERPLADSLLTTVRQLLFGCATWWLWTRPPRRMAIWLPWRDAVTVFWLGALAFVAGGRHGGWGSMAPDLDRLLLELLLAALAQLPLLLAVRETLRRQPDVAPAVRPLLALLPLALLSPLLSASLLVLWLGLAEGRRLLVWLGCAAGLAGFHLYYYSLHWPLLLKGLALAGVGVLLLAVWAWTRRRA